MTTVAPPGEVPAVAATDVATGIAAQVLGPSVRLAVLKQKPGRRCTWRAVSERGSVIVKAYASDRAATVAGRLRALRAGPVEPLTPEVLLLARRDRVVVLSDLPGIPLRVSILAGDATRCRAVGAALAHWHTHWAARAPAPLAPHPIEAELGTLDRCRGRLPPPLGDWVSSSARDVADPWECTTVVHRDLYEEQVVLGRRVGLVDLDDAAIGPPELDVGNLVAHLHLLALRREASVVRSGAAAVLAGYRSVGDLDERRLEQCWRLSLLRLGCLHRDPRLLARAGR